MPVRLNGSTSGYTELSAPAVAGSNTITLPTGAGSANQFLKNGSTAGSLGWSSLVEDSSGRVGIGTTSPSELLHLSKAGNLYLQATNTSTNVSAYFGQDSGGTYIGNVGTGSSVRFNVNNNEVARFDTSSRFLVGTSSSRDNLFNTTYSALFQVESQTTANAQASLTSTTAGINGANLILCHQRSGSVGGNTVVANNDQLGIISFQGADGTEMVPAASIEAYVDGTPGANDMPGRLVFSTTADGAASPTERMRITNGGNVFIGTTTATYPNPGIGLYPSGYAELGNNAGTAGTGFFGFARSNVLIGSITQSGTTGVAYNTSSDYRLKENVEPINGAVERILRLKPSRFNFIADPDITVDGFIAHEAQAVVPEAVHGSKDEVDDDGNPVYQGIDQSKLVPLLTAALQEAVAEIKALKDRVTALESA
jgi:hypothetical protein